MKKLGRTGSTLVTVIVAAIVLAIATTSGAVAGGLITSKQIKNNTIKSKDVKNNNLTGTDIKDGSLGKADLAAAAQGFTSIVTKVVQASGIADGAVSTRTVMCAAGQVAVGGGAYVTTNPVNFFGNNGGILESSLPATPGTTIFDTPSTFPAGDNTAPLGWRTRVRNDQGASETAVHYAMCASK